MLRRILIFAVAITVVGTGIIDVACSIYVNLQAEYLLFVRYCALKGASEIFLGVALLAYLRSTSERAKLRNFQKERGRIMYIQRGT